MDAFQGRAELDALIRRVQQATMAHWPPEGGERQPGLQPSPRLAAALAAAVQANDSGVALDVAAALAELQAAWNETAPVVVLEADTEP